jgi:pimeloyl-ACP methyl ester carboxylesterase
LRVEGAVRAYRGLTLPLGHPEPDVELSRLDLPILIVWGEGDPIIPLDAARRATTGLADARWEILPGVGHLPMEEAPERLAAAIGGFVAEVEARLGAGEHTRRRVSHPVTADRGVGAAER